MDDAFKFTFTTYAFQEISKLLHGWENQIKYIDSVWETLERTFDRQLFSELFIKQCKELALPFCTYDIGNAFKQANTIWRVEIMTDVVEKILLYSFDDIHYNTSGFVEWNKHHRLFSININKATYKMESNDPCRKQCLERDLQHVNNYLKLNCKRKAPVRSNENTVQAIDKTNDASNPKQSKHAIEHAAKSKVNENE